MTTLTTLDLRGEKPPAEAKPTLDDLLTTPTGRKMLAEHEKARATVQEVIDTRHEEEVAELQVKLDTASTAYETLRGEALDVLEILAEHANRLRDLRARYRALASALRKHGVLVDCPMDLFGQERKKFVSEARAVKEVLTRAC